MINRIINIKMNEDKSFDKKNFKLGNKFENNITKVIFNIPAVFDDLTKRYVLFQNSDGNRQFALPLKNDNSFILTTIVSQESGNWKILLILKENELQEDLTSETNETIIVSDVIQGNISDNYINDSEINPEMDENLKIFYDKIEEQITYITSEEFLKLIESKITNGATFTPNISEDGVLSWTNDKGLDNPDSVNIKGPRGDKGDSIKGDKGNDGVTFTPSIDNDGNLSFTNNGGLDNPNPINCKGTRGEAGVTFIPSIDENGDLSWTNNGGLDNPSPINCKGTKGNDGVTFIPSIDDDGNLSFTNNGGLDNPNPINCKGQAGADGKSAYESYLDKFNYKNLEYNDEVSGKTLRIKEETKGWAVSLYCNTSSLALKLVINDTEEYIQDMSTNEIFYFDSNREVVVPKKFTFLSTSTFNTYPSSVNIFAYKISDLLEIRESGEALTEKAWIESLKGDKGDSLEIVESETEPKDKSVLWCVEEEGQLPITSASIEKIEVVTEYPTERDSKTLYILVESES